MRESARAARGHRQIEHTADLALELWAEDELALLDEAVLALSLLLTEGTPVERRDAREVRIEGLDPADRLVQLLNEVLFFAATEGFLATGLEDAKLEGNALFGRLVGEKDALEKVRAELKSVTYHDLALKVGEGRAFARVVIDV